MKYAFIDERAGEHSVSALCRALGVSRSGYYAHRSRPESKRSVEDRRLSALVSEAHRKSRSTYGAPRVHAQLRRQGHRTSRKRVARLMRQAGLRGAVHPRRRSPSKNALAAPETPDLVQRSFAASRPGAVWCSDSKQIWTQQGWLHLAVVIDLHSRRVVGHACGSTASSAVAARALRSAAQTRRVAAGCVHHSDRGGAYVSSTYRAELRHLGAAPSLSRPGTPLDNAVAESFFSTLTREFLPGRRFETRREAERAIFDYVEVFYNRERLHSTLGYLSPAEFEARYYSNQTPPGVSTKTG